MTRYRAAFAWVWACLGIALLFGGVLDGVARHQTMSVSHAAEISALQLHSQLALAEALERLRQEPNWRGPLDRASPSLLSVVVENQWLQDGGGMSSDRLSWIPPHGVLLTVFRGEEEVTRRVVQPKAPTWSGQGEDDQEFGPFQTPLPNGPVESIEVATNSRLLAGSYGHVTLAAGHTVELAANPRGQRNFRLRSLTLRPGAALSVAEIPGCPAVLFVDESLRLLGKNRANWQVQQPGPAAILQIYGGPGCLVEVADCREISLVMAAPHVRLRGTRVHGAVASTDLATKNSEVIFEQALSGIPLQGLGPWSL